MGNDFYEFLLEWDIFKVWGEIVVGIGFGIIICWVIIDKNVCIGKNVMIVNKENV